MEKRIFISGTSGAGKTTLAEYISKRYRIPFITLSAKELWPKYKVESHAEVIKLCNENPNIGIDFQIDLLELRRKKLEGVNEFVTDRSPLDNLVYFMLQCSSYASKETINDYIGLCQGLYPTPCTQIYLTCNPGNIENDGYRIDNPHFQTMVDSLFRYYIEAEYLFPERYTRVKLLTISEWDWETRVEKVERLIENKTLWQSIKTRLRL